MIEFIQKMSSPKVELSSKKSNSSSVSFKEHMDQALSNQSQLREENQQTKIASQKEKIKNISEKITEKLTEPNLSDEEKAQLMAIQELLVFMDQVMTEIENSPEMMTIIADNPMLMQFVESVDQFLSQEGFQQESLPLFDMKAGQNLQKLANIVEYNFKDIPQLLTKPNFADQKALQVLIAELEMTALVEDQTMVIPELETIDLEMNTEPSESNEIVANVEDQEIVAQDMNNGSQAEGEFQQEKQFDERIVVQNKKTLKNEIKTEKELTFDTKAMTLESIDSELQNTSQTIKAQSLEPITMKASQVQNLYTAFSSPAARAQIETMLQNLSGRMAVVMGDGGSELRMKLSPPELGQMKLSLVTEDNIMRGKIVVETPEAKMLFEQNINNLKESLSQVGITLGDVDISFGSQGDFAEKFEAPNNLASNSKGVKVSSVGEMDTVQERRLKLDTTVDFTA